MHTECTEEVLEVREGWLFRELCPAKALGVLASSVADACSSCLLYRLPHRPAEKKPMTCDKISCLMKARHAHRLACTWS